MKLNAIKEKQRKLKAKLRKIEKELKAVERKIDKYWRSPSIFYATISGYRIPKLEELEEKAKCLREEKLNLELKICDLLFKELEIYEKEVR